MAVTKNGPVLPAGYCTPNSKVAPPVVTSLNGLTGDIKLKNLYFGNKFYDGSSDAIISAKDLDLETAVVYLGTKTKAQLDKITDAIVGDLYYCSTDNYYYLSVAENEWIKFASNIIIENEIAKREETDELVLAKLNSLNQNLQDTKTTLEQSIVEIKSDLDEKTTKINTLEVNTTTIDTTVTNIRANLRKTKQDVADCQSKLELVNSSILNIDTSLNETKADIVLINTNMEEMTNNISSITTDISTIQLDISNLNVSSSELAQQLDAKTKELEDQLTDDGAELDTIKSTLDSLSITESIPEIDIKNLFL